MYLHVITLYLNVIPHLSIRFFSVTNCLEGTPEGCFLQNTLNLFSLAHVWQRGNKKPPFSIIDLRTSYCNRSG